MTDFDPYDVLGLGRDATDQEIAAAKRRKAKETHPDVGGSEEAFDHMQRALAVLTDPVKRKKFDETGAIDEDKPDLTRETAIGIIDAKIGERVNDYILNDYDLRRDPRRTDLLAVVALLIEQEIAQLNAAARNGEKSIAYFRDMALRFRRKSPDAANHLAKSFENHAAAAEVTLANMLKQIPARKLALEILQDYEFRRDPPQDYSDPFASGMSPYAGRFG